MLVLPLTAAAASFSAPPLRRTASQKPPIVPLSEHLYSVGVEKLRREATINGVPAVDLICWPYVKGVDGRCECDGRLAHLFRGVCGKHISGELGAGVGCTRGEACKNVHPQLDALAALVEWHEAVIGPAELGTVSLVSPRHDQLPGELSRSAATAAGLGVAATCTASPELVMSRLQKHAASSVHVQMLLETAFLPELLASDCDRRLLSGRGAPKEISEAFAAADEVRRIVAELGAPPETSALGDGVTILDVCSGKGVVAALLSRLLPNARIVMLDACTDMDLTHVASRDNLRFVELDLFSREAGALLHELATEGRDGSRDGSRDVSGDNGISAPFQATVAIGMHLCGALSPRLLVLAAHLAAIDAVSVCPCCIKGTLGDHVKRTARADARPNYDVLLETLQGLTARELAERGEVHVHRDAELMSPRNGFVRAVKSASASAPSVSSRRRAALEHASMRVPADDDEPAAEEADAMEFVDPSDEACVVWPRGVRYRARVMYDGAEFTGMQLQPHGRSVACTIEQTLQRRVGCRVVVNPAGRTDTGVHARGQAVHFDIPPPASPRPLPTGEELQRSLNAMMPASLRLCDVELADEVDDDGRPWHARRWAAGKLYSYRLHYGRVFDPLERLQRFDVGHRALDVEAMKRAAMHMEGAVDCAAFANRRAGEPPPIAHSPEVTTRIVRRIEVIDEGDGHVRVDFHLQSALYKMVRNMVGLLVHVGHGGCAPSDVPSLIAARDRNRMPKPAPAHGLTLESVFYEVGWGGKFDHPLHKLCDKQ